MKYGPREIFGPDEGPAVDDELSAVDDDFVNAGSGGESEGESSDDGARSRAGDSAVSGPRSRKSQSMGPPGTAAKKSPRQPAASKRARKASGNGVDNTNPQRPKSSGKSGSQSSGRPRGVVANKTSTPKKAKASRGRRLSSPQSSQPMLPTPVLTPSSSEIPEQSQSHRSSEVCSQEGYGSQQEECR